MNFQDFFFLFEGRVIDALNMNDCFGLPAESQEKQKQYKGYSNLEAAQLWNN